MIDPTLHLPRPPFWLVSALIILAILSWLPLVFIARSRFVNSSQTRIHLVQDMDNQPRLGAQDDARAFVDHRAMRPRIPGTIARGELRADAHYERGYRLVRDEEGEWTADYFKGYPDQVRITAPFLKKGREQFGIACTPCHGAAGYGDGRVDQVASQLATVPGTHTQWVSPRNLNQTLSNGELKFGPKHYPNGKLFHVISEGMNNMPGYASQLVPRERWAVVAYVRALQISQHDGGGGDSGGKGSSSKMSRLPDATRRARAAGGSSD